jgi:hypothetical protein
VQGDKPFDRTPAEVVEAILTIFNRDHDTGTGEDKGICEVVCLRGNNDLALWREINSFCLPDPYKTAREQVAKLQKAVAESADLPSLFGQTAERLLAATRQAQAWARAHYEMLRLQLDDRERSGKYRLSPLDVHVCEWLELPHPRRRSNLDDGPTVVTQQAAAPPVRPTVQCFDCGAEANLLPDGAMPKKGCVVCGSATFGREPVQPVVAPSAEFQRITSEDDQREFAKVTGERVAKSEPLSRNLDNAFDLPATLERCAPSLAVADPCVS